MSFHTAACFFALSFVLPLLKPDLGFVQLFFSQESSFEFGRKILLRLVLLIFILSGIKLYLVSSGFIQPSFGVVLFAVIFIGVVVFTMHKMSQALKNLEAEKYQAQENLSRVKIFLDTTPDSLLICDLKGMILYSNIQCQIMFGMSEEELSLFQIQKLIPDFKPESEINLNKRELHDYAKRSIASNMKQGEFHITYIQNSIEIDGEQRLIVSIRDVSEREALEAQLLETSQRLRSAVEHSKIGFWDFDIENNNLVWDNSMYTLYGVRKEDFSHDFEAWEKTVHPEDIDTAKKEVEAAIKGESEFDTTFRVVQADGKIHFIRGRAQIIRDTSGNALRMIGTNWDITEEREAALVLEQANHQNRIFVEQAPSAIAMFDREMRYLAASKKWLSDYHIEHLNVIGMSHYEVFPEIGDDWKQIHRECLEGAINTCDEASFEREDGTMQWISWDVRPWHNHDGSIGGIVMNTANLTPYKESIRERLRIEEILEKTNDVARIGTWEVDLVKQKITWSKTTKSIHEVPADFEPNLEKGIEFYREGWSRELIIKAVDEGIKNGTPWDHELQLVTAKGNIIWVRAIGQAEYENGQVVRLIGMFQDISLIKNSEIRLNTMLDISTDQNDRLRNFAHIVSHNLRSHSGNINMMLDLFKDSHPEMVEDEMVNMLVISANNLKETIAHLNDVVLMTAMVEDSLVPISLKKSVDAAINQLAADFKKSNVQIENGIEESDQVMAIQAYMDSILINLLSNAIKYRREEADSFVKLWTEKQEDWTILHIEDNGLGIDLKRYADKIFGMYKTFHGNEDARGIGLFITKNQIEARGGTI
ncbi:MAG: PAS domain-containing protein, partial [Bacteroidota bacterium]|nr:PAS domain-containing protein [Bacteroidota bacterium]MDX5430649.1 PAS domain-containing protein [Bacteroidota bacterium]MDX5469399.1 PAS domain-containing protein [Bacteroidota bacterium]